MTCRILSIALAAAAAGGAHAQCELAKLIASDGETNDEFGTAVAVSTEGLTVAVGATSDDDAGSDAGAVYVYAREPSGWVEQAKLIGSGVDHFDDFGLSLALSADGDTLLVSAPASNVNGSTSGQAYVFTRAGSVWAQQAQLTPADGAIHHFFGSSVRLSSNGQTALIGAGGGQRAYVYELVGSTWTLQTLLTPPDPPSSFRFGHQVGLASDGATILIGARDGVIGGAGRAYVYVREDDGWLLQDTIDNPFPQPGHQFGLAVSLSDVGDTAAITDNNVAYVFSRNNGTWSLQGELLPFGPVSGGGFGVSTALDGTGDTVIVGAWAASESALSQGAGFVFRREASTWTGYASLTASDPQPGARAGQAVGLSSNGEVAVLGASESFDPLNGPGAAYLFALSQQDTDLDGLLDPCDNCPLEANPQQLDCDGDGMGDVCAIASGASLDCNANAVPDDCDVSAASELAYVLDDGTQETGLGFLGGGPMIWLNRFTVQHDAEEVVSIELAWATVPEGTETLIAVWRDPDGDGSPEDAQLLTVVGPVPVANPGADAFTSVPVGPVFVGNQGDVFFVGAQLMHEPGEFPAPLDETAPGLGDSWVAAGDDLAALSANDFLGPIDALGFPGNWLMRASRTIAPDCNGNSVPDECDIDAGSSADLDGNGVPDECEISGDLNDDGDVDITDFLALLAAWGPCPDPPAACAADLDRDGFVGILDFLILLGNWT